MPVYVTVHLKASMFARLPTPNSPKERVLRQKSPQRQWTEAAVGSSGCCRVHCDRHVSPVTAGDPSLRLQGRRRSGILRAHCAKSSSRARSSQYRILRDQPCPKPQERPAGAKFHLQRRGH
eukprot:3606450-Rhodomonas_salina.2